MPTGNLPANNYLGDGQRTTSEFQTGIDELLAYVNSLKAEVDALSATVIKEAAVRGVGNATGLVPDKAVLDTRLGTGGNLGTAATKDFGTGDNELAEYRQQDVVLAGDFDNVAVRLTRIGNLVTMTFVQFISFTSSASSHTSQTGAIPSEFRSNTAQKFIAYLGISAFEQYEVSYESGSGLHNISMEFYRNDALDARGNAAIGVPSITWVV